MVEAIDQVLEIWSGEPPYNIKGKYFHTSTERMLAADIGQGGYSVAIAKTSSPYNIYCVITKFKRGSRGGKERLAGYILKLYPVLLGDRASGWFHGRSSSFGNE